MPLRDHYRGWLRRELDWHSFHNAWATFLAVALNARLPEGFRASPNVQRSIEIDVATFGTVQGGSDAIIGPEGGGESWQPSAGTMTLPFDLAEEVSEVLVHGWRDGRYLAAAMELVSEGDKDRPEAREAFVAKCETYLQSGVGLVIVDAVTSRTANLHDELMARIGPGVAAWGERLYTTAYRPTGKNGSAQLTIWQEPMALGSPLPTVPLWLLHGPYVPVYLEETYEETFRQLRLPTERP
jgi:hypothetical protein